MVKVINLPQKEPSAIDNLADMAKEDQPDAAIMIYEDNLGETQIIFSTILTKAEIVWMLEKAKAQILA